MYENQMDFTKGATLSLFRLLKFWKVASLSKQKYSLVNIACKHVCSITPEHCFIRVKEQSTCNL